MDKPEIDFVDPEPPTDLVVVDLVAGAGVEAQSGRIVEGRYGGVRRVLQPR